MNIQNRFPDLSQRLELRSLAASSGASQVKPPIMLSEPGHFDLPGVFTIISCCPVEG
jgi:hypothetical protein